MGRGRPGKVGRAARVQSLTEILRELDVSGGPQSLDEAALRRVYALDFPPCVKGDKCASTFDALSFCFLCFCRIFSRSSRVSHSPLLVSLILIFSSP